MAPKRPTSSQPTSSPKPSTSKPSSSSNQSTTTQAPSSSLTSAFTPTKSSSSSNSQNNSVQEVVQGLWNGYLKDTPQRVKLVDCFMAFLVVVGGLQFAYAVVGGSFPFNAFLSGFSATVGQFVLTASLRIQCNPANKAEFKTVSHERAFADFVLGSLILHFFCVNFIN